MIIYNNDFSLKKRKTSELIVASFSLEISRRRVMKQANTTRMTRKKERKKIEGKTTTRERIEIVVETKHGFDTDKFWRGKSIPSVMRGALGRSYWLIFERYYEWQGVWCVEHIHIGIDAVLCCVSLFNGDLNLLDFLLDFIEWFLMFSVLVFALH